MNWFILALLVVPYFAFASSKAISALRRFCSYDRRVNGALLVLALLLPYLWAELAQGVQGKTYLLLDLGKMLAYVLLPALLALYRPKSARPFDWRDILTILILWFPIEFDWLPDTSIRLAAGLSLPIAKIIGVNLAFLIFLVLQPLNGMGYNWRLTLRDVRYALLALVGFMVVGLPLGIFMRFITPGLAPFDWQEWLLGFLGIYLLIGVPEELLFRGVIQNLIEQRFGRSWITLVVAALIFGAAHLDNSTAGYSAPNFAYMLMAGLAGVAYGWAWWKSGKITCAALTHTLVDWLWGIVFA